MLRKLLQVLKGFGVKLIRLSIQCVGNVVYVCITSDPKLRQILVVNYGLPGARTRAGFRFGPRTGS